VPSIKKHGIKFVYGWAQLERNSIANRKDQHLLIYLIHMRIYLVLLNSCRKEKEHINVLFLEH